MDAKNIIMQGERAKYFISSQKPDFSLEDNDYYLEIVYGVQNKKITIPKSEFLYLNEKWLFSFPTTDIIGPVNARLVMEIPDESCPNGIRQEIDEQYIGIVITAPCPRFVMCPACSGGHEIEYERTEESDIGDRYARLCDKDGHPIKTVTDGFIYVLRNI